jgi:hypothetical protein
MNIVFTPYGWEWRIREGQLSGQLLRPMHPIHYDIAGFAGGKIPWLVYYLPIAVILSLIFKPTFDVRPAEVAVFAVAIWGARTSSGPSTRRRSASSASGRRGWVRSSPCTSSSNSCSPVASSR